VNKRFLIALCSTLSAGAVFASPLAGATTAFLTAKAPAQAAVKEFNKGSLAVTVDCRRACNATVFATIKASTAKHLGFPSVKGKFVLIGTGTKALKARTPTTIRVVPTSAAKKHLKASVEVVGSAKGVPTAPGTVNNYFTGWYTTLG